jgi:DNA-directed RNA polymerase specialized sigma24 family protein
VSTDSYMQLLGSLRAGHAAALQLLSKRYFVRLRGLVRGKLWDQIRDEKDVQVIASILDSLVENHREDADIGEEDPDSLWHVLARIALRHCDKHNKRHQRERERLGPLLPLSGPRTGPDGEEGGGVDPADDTPPPEAAVEFGDWLDAFSRKLTPRQQAVLQLTFEGRGRKSMRELLKVSGSTVERDVREIRAKLQGELELLQSS